METNWAWLAGFFDGEGCTLLVGNGAINLVITQVDREVLEKAQAIAGGSIYGPYKYGTSNSRPSYRWCVSSYDACTHVLKRMWPYLGDVKQAQAKAAYDRRLVHKAS